MPTAFLFARPLTADQISWVEISRCSMKCQCPYCRSHEYRLVNCGMCFPQLFRSGHMNTIKIYDKSTNHTLVLVLIKLVSKFTSCLLLTVLYNPHALLPPSYLNNTHPQTPWTIPHGSHSSSRTSDCKSRPQFPKMSTADHWRPRILFGPIIDYHNYRIIHFRGTHYGIANAYIRLQNYLYNSPIYRKKCLS
ncbi:unnamed protein product [Allacma fusca]|uniref:Uncharacterized protein n=1 Tax=Allacma fusca TaxID=39272 RepID=A0A8J2KUT2_9HEXA|nr:unnamed protein product [Allacma fusca]